MLLTHVDKNCQINQSIKESHPARPCPHSPLSRSCPWLTCALRVASGQMAVVILAILLVLVIAILVVMNWYYRTT